MSRKTHQVALGRIQSAPITTTTSQDKLLALEGDLCLNCNAHARPGHICTRHPSEDAEQARPYS